MDSVSRSFLSPPSAQRADNRQAVTCQHRGGVSSVPWGFRLPQSRWQRGEVGSGGHGCGGDQGAFWAELFRLELFL